jgi:hypothetical protein
MSANSYQGNVCVDSSSQCKLPPTRTGEADLMSWVYSIEDVKKQNTALNLMFGIQVSTQTKMRTALEQWDRRFESSSLHVYPRFFVCKCTS